MNFKQLIAIVALLGTASGYAAVGCKKFGEKDNIIIKKHLKKYGITDDQIVDVRLQAREGCLKPTPLYAISTELAQGIFKRQSLSAVGSSVFKMMFAGAREGVIPGWIVGAAGGFMYGIANPVLSRSEFLPVFTGFAGAVVGCLYGYGIGLSIGAGAGLVRGILQYRDLSGLERVTPEAPIAGCTWIRIKELDRELQKNTEPLVNSTIADGGYAVIQ